MTRAEDQPRNRAGADVHGLELPELRAVNVVEPISLALQGEVPRVHTGRNGRRLSSLEGENCQAHQLGVVGFQVEVLSETDFDSKMTRQLTTDKQFDGKPTERSLRVQAQRCGCLMLHTGWIPQSCSRPPGPHDALPKQRTRLYCNRERSQGVQVRRLRAWEVPGPRFPGEVPAGCG